MPKSIRNSKPKQVALDDLRLSPEGLQLLVRRKGLISKDGTC